MGYPGVINHMELDANTFAKWDVDYVKLDGCYADIIQMNKGYPEFGRLLNATGRPMVYSCSWPVYQEEQNLMVCNEYSAFFPLFSRWTCYHLLFFFRRWD